MSSQNTHSVATLSQWSCGVILARSGSAVCSAHPATVCSKSLSAQADSSFNPGALNFTQIGKSYHKLRRNDPDDNEGLASEKLLLFHLNWE